VAGSGEAPRVRGLEAFGLWSGCGGDWAGLDRCECAGPGDDHGVGEPGDGQQREKRRGEVADEGGLAGLVTEDAEPERGQQQPA